MRWRKLVAITAAVLLWAAFGPALLAGEIREGATLEAKPNLLWFEDASNLARWQAVKAGGDAEALAAFEEEALSERAAWQFTSPLEVKVIGYEPDMHQVNVEMLTPGRMQGTTWFLDSDALQ
jgi:hypothetical protein